MRSKAKDRKCPAHCNWSFTLLHLPLLCLVGNLCSDLKCRVPLIIPEAPTLMAAAVSQSVLLIIWS